MPAAADLLDVDQPEADFQADVLTLAARCRWQAMHVRRTPAAGGRPARRGAWTTATSIKGWPDLVLYHPASGTGPLYRELKSDTGRLTPDQKQVLSDLAACGCDVAVWRPRDMDTLVIPTLTAVARVRRTTPNRGLDSSAARRILD